MSKLLRRVRLSDETFMIGSKPTDEPDIKYVPEELYNSMLDRSKQEKEEAYRNGFSDGKQMGLAEGMKPAEAIIRRFSQLMADIENKRSDIYRQAEMEVVELSLEIARRVIFSKAETDPNLIIDCVRKAVKLLLDRSRLVLRISPDQEEFVRKNLEALYAIDDRIQKIEIEVERRVQPGGCILETKSGNVDARIETELRNISNVLKKANLNHVSE